MQTKSSDPTKRASYGSCDEQNLTVNGNGSVLTRKIALHQRIRVHGSIASRARVNADNKGVVVRLTSVPVRTQSIFSFYRAKCRRNAE